MKCAKRWKNKIIKYYWKARNEPTIQCLKDKPKHTVLLKDSKWSIMLCVSAACFTARLRLLCRFFNATRNTRDMKVPSGECVVYIRLYSLAFWDYPCTLAVAACHKARPCPLYRPRARRVWARYTNGLNSRAERNSITKTRLFIYKENFTSKNWKFSDKKLWYFSYFCSKHRLWVLR